MSTHDDLAHVGTDAQRAAGTHHLERTLRSYGVLTRGRLQELSGAKGWDDQHFDAALAAGIRTGTIVQLSDELFELAADQT